jgi:hypothetical protein
MTKNISTLVKDIEDVIQGNGGWTQTVSAFFRDNVSDVVDSRLQEQEDQPRNYLRLSGMGTPCKRKLWYQVNSPHEGEDLPAHTRLKFLYGDILESLIISLAMAAGHRVEGCQDVLHVAGIKGHRDCVIDGITVDIKSASSYGFKKFAEGRLRDDDPFGYISQLSSYVYAGRENSVESHPTLGAFLVIDKSLGHLCLDMYNFGPEIETKEQDFEDTKQMVAQLEPPERGYEDEEDGKSGNRKLGVSCSYCSYKDTCWPGLRTFLYGRGPTFLTNVAREPKVPEVT